jgi:hypothetical protein
MSRHHGARVHSPTAPPVAQPPPAPPAAVRVPLTSAAPPSAAPASSGARVALRLVWMGLGNLVLAAAAILIMQRGGYSWRDVLFWGTAFGLVAVRGVDITVFGGTTADYRPATSRDLRRYAVRILALAAVVWVVSHLVGPIV